MRSKVAICLYGLPECEDKYGKGNFKNVAKNFESLKKNIIDFNSDYDFDIFIHTWESNQIDQLNSNYHPNTLLVERNSFLFSWEQVISMIGGGWKIHVLLASIIDSLNKKIKIRSSEILGRVHSILSRWISTKKVIESALIENLEIFIVARLDLNYLRPIDLSLIDSKKIYFPVMNSYFHNRKLTDCPDYVDIGINSKKLADIFQISGKQEAAKLIVGFEKVKNGTFALSPHLAMYEIYESEIRQGAIEFKFSPGYHFCVGRDFK